MVGVHSCLLCGSLICGQASETICIEDAGLASAQTCLYFLISGDEGILVYKTSMLSCVSCLTKARWTALWPTFKPRTYVAEFLSKELDTTCNYSMIRSRIYRNLWAGSRFPSLKVRFSITSSFESSYSLLILTSSRPFTACTSHTKIREIHPSGETGQQQALFYTERRP